MTVGAIDRQAFSNEHALQLKFVRHAGFVADGRDVYYSVAEIGVDRRERHSLWLCDRLGGATRRVAGGLDDVKVPAAAPDGRGIALVAELDGANQLCLAPLDGGPVKPLTSLPQGVTGRPAWSPDSRSIAFTAGPATRSDPTLPYRVVRATYRLDGIGYVNDATLDLYVVDVETRAVRRLTEDDCMNSDPRWSPDGMFLSYLVSVPPDRVWDQSPSLYVLTVASGEARPVIDTWGAAFHAEWCADSRRIAFVGCPAERGRRYRQKWDLWTVDVAGGEPSCRTESLIPGVSSWVQADLPVWEELSAPRVCVSDTHAFVSGQVDGDVVIYRIGLTGHESVEPAVERPGTSAYLVDIDRAGAILYLSTSFLQPPELVLDSRRVTLLNDELLARTVSPHVRELEVQAADGLRTQAWALTPSDQPGPWPTVLYIHGGPYGAFGSTYMIDFQLLVGAGFAVIFNNFRGSGGYGTEFARKIFGDWGRAGALDHHATVDAAIAAGIAEPDRVGVCGYSHGAFATCWLLGTSNRFRAALAENPVTNWATAFGLVDSEWWVREELGGSPHEVPAVYRDSSPLTYATNCRTPLLLIVGEADLRCHPAESEQYYRVLKGNGVTTEMLRLPNSSHIGTWNGPVEARVAQNEALIEWFARHLVTASNDGRADDLVSRESVDRASLESTVMRSSVDVAATPPQGPGEV
jgi:dipeptidyl aminopeptidase/acylaminoacyl peptidase